MENVVAPPKADLPKVSVNGPDGASVAAQAQSPPSSKAASPAPPTSGPGSNLNKVSIVFLIKKRRSSSHLNSPLLIRCLPLLLLLPTKNNA